MQPLKQTHIRYETLVHTPERNPEVGIFLGGSWNCIVIGVQERLWSNAFPGTTNVPNGSWTHDPSAMSGKRHPLSHTKIPLKYETNWIVWIAEKQTLKSSKGSVLLPDWCMSYDNSQSRWIHQFMVAQICRGYYQFALLLRLYFLMLVYKSTLFQSYPPCLKCKIVYNATKKAGMMFGKSFNVIDQDCGSYQSREG